MSLHLLGGVLLGLWVLGTGIYLAVIRPDPPPTAKTATRTSRRAIGVAAIAIGVFNIYSNLVP